MKMVVQLCQQHQRNFVVMLAKLKKLPSCQSTAGRQLIENCARKVNKMRFIDIDNLKMP